MQNRHYVDGSQTAQHKRLWLRICGGQADNGLPGAFAPGF